MQFAESLREDYRQWTGTSRPESLWLAENFLDIAAQRYTNYNDATGISFILVVEDICAQYVVVNS